MEVSKFGSNILQWGTKITLQRYFYLDILKFNGILQISEIDKWLIFIAISIYALKIIGWGVRRIACLISGISSSLNFMWIIPQANSCLQWKLNTNNFYNDFNIFIKG